MLEIPMKKPSANCCDMKIKDAILITACPRLMLLLAQDEVERPIYLIKTLETVSSYRRDRQTERQKHGQTH
jgi:hypothetical protein